MLCGAKISVSVLFSEPKIPQYGAAGRTSRKHQVSVLFSEPKIPQFQFLAHLAQRRVLCFSALQRAENSSIVRSNEAAVIGVDCFSALQRAENSSIIKSSGGSAARSRFQCSSASRKFLNPARGYRSRNDPAFQCSSASRKFLNFFSSEVQNGTSSSCFSALQRAENSSIAAASAPKVSLSKFQCSSASRKFLNGAMVRGCRRRKPRFQCSSASRKFLN